MRMLNYSPEHTNCHATFYGSRSLYPTPVCAFNSLSADTPGSSVTATGVALDVDRSTMIVKKLKLTGVPYVIFKNTAFIKDMLSIALEVANFEGVSVWTVSRISDEIRNLRRNQMLHLKLRLKIKVSHFSPTHTLKIKNPQN